MKVLAASIISLVVGLVAGGLYVGHLDQQLILASQRAVSAADAAVTREQQNEYEAEGLEDECKALLDK